MFINRYTLQSFCCKIRYLPYVTYMLQIKGTYLTGQSQEQELLTECLFEAFSMPNGLRTPCAWAQKCALFYRRVNTRLDIWHIFLFPQTNRDRCDACVSRFELRFKCRIRNYCIAVSLSFFLRRLERAVVLCAALHAMRLTYIISYQVL